MGLTPRPFILTPLPNQKVQSGDLLQRAWFSHKFGLRGWHGQALLVRVATVRDLFSI